MDDTFPSRHSERSDASISQSNIKMARRKNRWLGGGANDCKNSFRGGAVSHDKMHWAIDAVDFRESWMKVNMGEFGGMKFEDRQIQLRVLYNNSKVGVIVVVAIVVNTGLA